MAQPSPEVEVIGKGILAAPSNSESFCQNMLWYDGHWQVRKGFGVLGEFDTTLSKLTYTPRITTTVEGLTQHLGSQYINTRFGHEQIVSVFETLAWTNLANDKNAERVYTYSVQIYDITTNDHWEELLLQSTEPNSKRLPILHGHYEGASAYAKPVVRIGQESEGISFVEFNDTLFFASETIGVFYYRPAMFRGNRCKALSSVDAPHIYSENTLVKRLVLSDNPSHEGVYTYYDEFPEPIKALGLVLGRLAFISDKSVFFSDPLNKPGCVIVGNAVNINSEFDVTAIQEVNNTLLIFTELETFLFTFADQLLVSGRLLKISETIGCSGVKTITKYENTVIWADANGVYQYAGNMDIKKVSSPIDPFFETYLTNPLAYFHIGNHAGVSSATANQPKVQVSYKPENSSITYYPKLRLVLLTVPEERITLCLSSNGEWSLWSYDSAAYYEDDGGTQRPAVGIRENMTCDQIVCSPTEMYAIGTDDTLKITTDQSSTWIPSIVAPPGFYQQDINRNQTFKSYYITQYGRGGGIDRSEEEEDYRYGIGEWDFQGLTVNNAAIGTLDANSEWDLYIGEPIFLPKSRTSGFEADVADVLVPVYAKTALGAGSGASTQPWLYTPKALKINFQFDSLNWGPVSALNAGGDTVVSLFAPTPMERYGSGASYATANFPAVAGAQATYTATLAEISIDWSAHTANLANTYGMQHFWNQWGYAETLLGNPGDPQHEGCLPLNPYNRTLLFYIPFRKLLPANSVSKMNIHTVEGYLYYDAYGTIPIGATRYYKSNNWVFNFSSLAEADRPTKDKKAQAVDWCYASAPIGLETPGQKKARGIFTQLKSKGTATNEIDNGWGTGGATYSRPRLFNSVVSSDNRRWNGQAIDFRPSGGNPSGITESSPLDTTITQNSIRTKVRDTTQVMRYQVFDDPNLLWGDVGQVTGNVLVDDKQFGELADSNSTKGAWFTWMFFGYVLNKAEELVIRSAKAAIRKVSGGRRRKGH